MIEAEHPLASGTVVVGEPLRVLVVEHNAADAELMIAHLERAGFALRADVVTTRDKLIARLTSGSYEIILSDYRLPGWTAMDALRLVRQYGHDTPLIVVTGTLNDEQALDCLKEGAADYVIKEHLARLPTAVRRALAERAMRDGRRTSEERYRMLFDSSPLPTWVFDRETHAFLAVNQAAVRHYGYSREEFLAMHIADLQPSGEVPTPSLSHHRTKNGTLIAVEISGHTMTWDTRPAELVVAHDVTERNGADAALRESEARFRQLAENVDEVFFMIDGQYRETLYLSPAYEQMWGRSCASVYENPLSFLEPVPPEDRDLLVAAITKAQTGQEPGEVEFRVIRPDGDVRWVLAHAHPVRNDRNEVFRIIGTCLDITKRKHAEQELRVSEQRLRNVFETLNLIVLGLGLDGNVEYANPFFLALTDYTRDEVLGQPWIEHFLPEEHRREVHDIFRELVENGLHAHHQSPILTKAGKQRTITWHNTVLRDTQGRCAGTLSIGEDVTDHLQLEHQFRQAQKMEAVGKLAGGIAHDFNNLLTAILGSAELVLERLRLDAPEREDIEEIHKAGRRAADLTRELLAFSRQQVLAPRILDLNDLVVNMEKLLQRLIGEDVVLRTALTSPLGSVKADPGQLEQVIVNLAVNARDAMPLGGQLTIETSNVDLDEAYADAHFLVKAGSYVLLTVTDTGTGMDAETKSHMFEPFFTTKEQGKGTGLGLPTVYGIVKQSDGYVWVYSELGRGTAFKIYLPRIAAPADPLVATAEVAAPRGVETVLVVEDDEQVRRLTRKMLEARGHTVLVAADGGAAVQLLEAHTGTIDLLVTDVVMPGMSGRELVERVAVLRPSMRVLYLSGYTDDAIVRHGVLQAGIAFLQKPFAADALVRKVREVLDAEQ